MPLASSVTKMAKRRIQTRTELLTAGITHRTAGYKRCPECGTPNRVWAGKVCLGCKGNSDLRLKLFLKNHPNPEAL
jgi:hypothetical protein